MSVLPDGRTVKCDGHGCDQIAPLPVALRRALSGSGAAFLPPPKDCGILGWLFAGQQEHVRHFCPCCLPRYLHQVMEGLSGSRPTGQGEQI